MDPINFAIHSLPKIEYTTKLPSVTYAIIDKEQYNEFRDDFISYISDDCYAITLNDEIIFNMYKEQLVREDYLDEMIREKIIDNPDVLFNKIFRKKEAARVIVYMSGENPYFVAVYYSPDCEIITVEYYKSTKYIDKYDRFPV
jgi:hypothetical protein